MKTARLFAAPAALILSLTLLASCEDDTSPIGSSISKGEVSILVDSMVMDIKPISVEETSFDARTTTKLIGRINVPEYGSLSSSFVTQLMPATILQIPDSIGEDRIDSLKMVMSIPRGYVTGDSLAPQQLKVYRLNRQLPADIKSSFDVDQYYSVSDLLATKSYTVSAISQNDTIFHQAKYIPLDMNLSREMGLDFFRQYRSNPEIFQWPQTFAEKFPGLYVVQNFGNGCVAGVTGLGLYLYWNYTTNEYVKLENDEYGYKKVTHTDSVCLFSSQPEVLSSNVISYKISDKLRDIAASGKSVITTPGGYHVDITMPAREIISRFDENKTLLSIVSSLSMSIPAKGIDNDFSIGTAPYLLLIKRSERDKFFAENKLPDNETSFYATYNSTTKSYEFTGLRPYIDNLIRKGEVTDDDVEYSLLPVMITSEAQSPSYYGSSGVSYVVGCSPYMARPTMTELETDNVTVKFIYSTQKVE